MNLSQFVEETLSEIAAGVKNAKEKSRSLLAIAPGALNGRSVAEITYIDFDVTVVVTDSQEGTRSAEGGASGGLKVLSVGLDAKGQIKSDAKDARSAAVTQKISFKVPICMAADFLLQHPDKDGAG